MYVWVVMVCTVSIPQRSDLNILPAPSLIPPLRLVSIPQRSDLNPAGRRLVGIWRTCFNPATVWFEPYYKKLGSGCLIVFQSRNGLIWTCTGWEYELIGSMFQSRNGLIWTLQYLAHGLRHRCFNPATVWFEPSWQSILATSKSCFNPATVWFEPRGMAGEQTTTYRFQSRNGLIWTGQSARYSDFLQTFQSRNGLIWTFDLLDFIGHEY